MRISLLLLFTFLCMDAFSQKEMCSLKEYTCECNCLRLSSVFKVEPKDDSLILSGFNKEDKFKKVKVIMKKNEVLGISERSHIFSGPKHWNILPITLTTVPFRIRPEKDEFKESAASGLSNLGVNFDLARLKIDRYFANGRKSTHKFYGGILIAPSIEELDSIQTKGFLEKGIKSKQLFISTGLTLNYSYNGITFSFVPFGFDFSTSQTGKKWIHNKARWWGFGIGIGPKFFETVVNK